MRRGLLVCLLAACAAEAPDIADVDDAVRVCPVPTVTKGIDVSVYQGTIDWTKVKAVGVSFAFIRVSDGLPPIDSKFQRNWAAARAAGVVRGAYQFYRSDEDPIAQADLLLDTMGTLADDDLPPVADVETSDGKTAAEIAANLRVWIDRVEAGSGRRPIIYSGPGFWNYSVASAAFADIPLWLAHWTTACPSVPTGFTAWTFWQYSSTGSVDGISGAVDLDEFDGDAATLAAFARASAIEGEPPPPVGTPDPAPPAAPPIDIACPGFACETELRGAGCGVGGGGGLGAAALIVVALCVLPSRRARRRDPIR